MLKILHAEDDAEFAKQLADALGGMLDIELRSTFEMTIGALESWPVKFDFVLLDLSLPDSNKELTISRIPELVKAAGDAKIVVFTALGEPGDRERCIELGAIWFCPKNVGSLGKFQPILCVLDNLSNLEIYGTKR